MDHTGTGRDRLDGRPDPSASGRLGLLLFSLALIAGGATWSGRTPDRSTPAT